MSVNTDITFALYKPQSYTPLSCESTRAASFPHIFSR